MPMREALRLKRYRIREMSGCHGSSFDVVEFTMLYVRRERIKPSTRSAFVVLILMATYLDVCSSMISQAARNISKPSLRTFQYCLLSQ